MKLFKTLLTILFISLLSSPSWSLTWDDLVERNDLYYEKFSDVPFTGKVTGQEQGSFKNGVKDGAWIGYYETGELYSKGNFKTGKEEGAWVYYHNGQLESKGNFEHGKREGHWVFYWSSGELSYKGNYKNGFREGAWVGYHVNGQLSWKGNYKNSQHEGFWVSYEENGTVQKRLTGMFKDGIKISD